MLLGDTPDAVTAATTIPANLPGVAVVADENGWRRIRGLWVPPAQVDALAVEHAHRRVDWEDLGQYGYGGPGGAIAGELVAA